jgi:histidine ammonia-lyase
VNTGFGLFSDVKIGDADVNQLQVNLIRSHAAGVGEPLPVSTVRRLVALRLNVFARGNSGIRTETVRRIVAAFNSGVVPKVPCKGTVGASGDLAPLAHVALGFMGEGEVWLAQDNAWVPAPVVFERFGLEPISLSAKEGLAMINGTQMMTAVSVEALVRAERAALTADVVAAMTLEALRGTVRAFDPAIHAARPHPGQGEVASRLRDLLGGPDPSELQSSHAQCGKVQDSYTLRCIPQVHGIVHDTLNFCRSILQREINSSTDNPMVFAETSRLVSGGNFHGEFGDDVPCGLVRCVFFFVFRYWVKKIMFYSLKTWQSTNRYVAKAADFLGIAIHEIASMSERRIERLNNAELSGLPAFLVKDGGLNSGFMIAHCTAASLVSENMVLVHPSSSHSLSTSAAKEDHVSMGGFAARKALQITEHVETVVAIELLCACQALDLLRPLRAAAALEVVHALVRAEVPMWDKDRFMAPDIEKVRRLVSSGRVAEAVSPHLK